MNQLQKEREQAVHLRRMGGTTAKVAKELGRSEQWVRKCWREYNRHGWAGLVDKRKGPNNHGRRLPEEVRQKVLETRSELEAEAESGQGLKYIGSKAVRTRLKTKKVKPLPSVASIERIMRQGQMTKPKLKKAKIVYPHLKPNTTHQLCQVDHVPHYLTGGQKVYCFNAIDVVSRYPTGQTYTSRGANDARDFLIHVWQTIGIPRYTQVDNEACFSGGFTHPYVLGQCVRLALMVGTQLVFSPIRYPKSNSNVERFHQDYNKHVWQDTYLNDLSAIQQQADKFFALYRHSEHHQAFNDQTPSLVHQAVPPVRLSHNFEIPDGQLPLYAGQIHFIRRIQPDGSVSVLNVAWHIPHPELYQAVWVTVQLSPRSSTLAIYDAAPDVFDRKLLASYPFVVKQAVLSHPTSSSFLQPVKQIVRHSFASSFNLFWRVAETFY